MQIAIRNYEQKDEEQLKQLINLGYEEDHLLTIVNTNNVKLALSAFAENKLVGSLIVWTNTFHPYCTYFRILCDPFYFEHNGWCGVNGHQSIELVPQLIKKQINYAVKHNFKSLVGEFDTTDFYAMEVLRRFPFAPSPTWITYQR
ncbi:MAG: hypothetical protein ABWX61_06780 [Paenisporosarcina sp.]